MLRTRVIPTLLVKGTGLYKGTQFSGHRYIGDPMNAIRIFCTKEVDELALLDISATADGRTIDPKFVQRVARETLMPLTVGGGIRTLEQARALLHSGAEKIVCGTHALKNPQFVTEIARFSGSQSIAIAMDARRDRKGNLEIFVGSGTDRIPGTPAELARRMADAGAGEILLTSIDREGTGQGFDLDLIRQVSSAVSIPVIASGGAANVAHLAEAVIEGGASAVSAGSMFVFHGPRKAVLISFPSQQALRQAFEEKPAQ